MKTPELLISELANYLKVETSSEDTPESMVTKIMNAIKALKPVEADEDDYEKDKKPMEMTDREEKAVKKAREAEIEMALSEGKIIPAQAAILKEHFATGDLKLSETSPVDASDNAFETLMACLKLADARTPSEERTKVQSLQLSESGSQSRNPVAEYFDKKYANN